MAMVGNAKRWTLDELHRLPDDGNKYELVFGDLFVTPPPGEEHEQILVRLSAVLTPYVREHHLGGVFHPRAVVRFGGSEAEPDLFVRSLRPASGHRRVPDWDDAPAPRLVVEVLSPATRRRDLGDKRRLYLAAGVDEYWIIDPERREVRVARAGREDLIVSDTIVWAPTSGPPLSIDIATLFDE